MMLASLIVIGVSSFMLLCYTAIAPKSGTAGTSAQRSASTLIEDIKRLHYLAEYLRTDTGIYTCNELIFYAEFSSRAPNIADSLRNLHHSVTDLCQKIIGSTDVVPYSKARVSLPKGDYEQSIELILTTLKSSKNHVESFLQQNKDKFTPGRGKPLKQTPIMEWFTSRGVNNKLIKATRTEDILKIMTRARRNLAALIKELVAISNGHLKEYEVSNDCPVEEGAVDSNASNEGTAHGDSDTATTGHNSPEIREEKMTYLATEKQTRSASPDEEELDADNEESIAPSPSVDEAVEATTKSEIDGSRDTAAKEEEKKKHATDEQAVALIPKQPVVEHSDESRDNIQEPETLDEESTMDMSISLIQMGVSPADSIQATSDSLEEPNIGLTEPLGALNDTSLKSDETTEQAAGDQELLEHMHEFESLLYTHIGGSVPPHSAPSQPCSTSSVGEALATTIFGTEPVIPVVLKRSESPGNDEEVVTSEITTEGEVEEVHEGDVEEKEGDNSDEPSDSPPITIVVEPNVSSNTTELLTPDQAKDRNLPAPMPTAYEQAAPNDETKDTTDNEEDSYDSEQSVEAGNAETGKENGADGETEPPKDDSTKDAEEFQANEKSIRTLNQHLREGAVAHMDAFLRHTVMSCLVYVMLCIA